MSVSTSEESERRLAEAMRAQATGVGRPGFVGRNPGRSASAATDPPAPDRPRRPAAAAGRRRAEQPSGLWAALVQLRFPLLLALLGGIVLGVALALLSLLAPGCCPPLG